MKEWKVIHQESKSDYFWVEFEKQLDGKGKFDRHIHPDQEQYLEWAQTPDIGRIRKHKGVGTFGVAIVDFANEKEYKTFTNYNWIVWFHVWSMMICWTVVSDFLI